MLSLLSENTDRFPLDQKFRFHFPPGNLQWRMESISLNFRKKEKPCKVNRNFRKILTGKFPSTGLSSRNLTNFRLNASLFGNSN